MFIFLIYKDSLKANYGHHFEPGIEKPVIFSFVSLQFRLKICIGQPLFGLISCMLRKNI